MNIKLTTEEITKGKYEKESLKDSALTASIRVANTLQVKYHEWHIKSWEEMTGRFEIIFHTEKEDLKICGQVMAQDKIRIYFMIYS